MTDVILATDMSENFKKGDRVQWQNTEGTIEEIITEPIEFKNHHFEASKDEPAYRVKSSKSGKDAIHKADALKKVKEK